MFRIQKPADLDIEIQLLHLEIVLVTILAATLSPPQ
jgi:hypothetical protein